MSSRKTQKKKIAIIGASLSIKRNIYIIIHPREKKKKNQALNKWSARKRCVFELWILCSFLYAVKCCHLSCQIESTDTDLRQNCYSFHLFLIDKMSIIWKMLRIFFYHSIGSLSCMCLHQNNACFSHDFQFHSLTMMAPLQVYIALLRIQRKRLENRRALARAIGNTVCCTAF